MTFSNGKHFAKDHAAQNIPLAFNEAYELGMLALQGCKHDVQAQIQSIALLSALHNRATYAWKLSPGMQGIHGHYLPQNAAEQIAGVCAAIFENDIETSEYGFAEPDVPYVMDNCGMGGDLLVTANVSTLAALIASTAGITMCKHGSPANADSGRHGSSDFVGSTLGIETYPSKDALERCVANQNFGYIEALDTRYKIIHHQTHDVARLPHMNDIIGPITSPINPRILTRRVVGLNQLVPPRVVAEAYQILNERSMTNLQHGLFVRGFADTGKRWGIDEVSICPGGTQVAELRDGKIREFKLHARDFGVTPISMDSISPPEGVTKGEFSLRILKRVVAGPPLKMVLANSSLLFYLAGFAKDFREGYLLAKDVMASGLVATKVDSVRSALAADTIQAK